MWRDNIFFLLIFLIFRKTRNSDIQRRFISLARREMQVRFVLTDGSQDRSSTKSRGNHVNRAHVGARCNFRTIKRQTRIRYTVATPSQPYPCNSICKFYAASSEHAVPGDRINIVLGRSDATSSRITHGYTYVRAEK